MKGAIFQGLCVFMGGTRAERENLKKVDSDEDNRLFIVFLTFTKPIFGNFLNQYARSSKYLSRPKYRQPILVSESEEIQLVFNID